MHGLASRVANFRWGMLLLFVVGYALTKSYFEFAIVEYFTYNLLACLACGTLLYQLKDFDQRYTAVWFTLVVLLTIYPLRFYWITLDPLPVQMMLPHNPYSEMIDNRLQLLYAFKLSVVNFAVFCCSVAAMLCLFRHEDTLAPQRCFYNDTHVQEFVSKCLLVVLVPAILLLGYISHKYHIAEMGISPGDPLPFRLKGLIFYARTVFIPLLIILLICSAEWSGRNLMSRLGILILVGHGVLDMILRGSRSSLLLSLMLLIFLVMAGGIRLHRNEKILIGIAVAVAFFIVPFMTIYRNQRAYLDLLTLNALSQAVIIAGDNWWGLFTQGIKFVFFRMPGVETTWCMLSWTGAPSYFESGVKPLGAQSLEAFRSPNGIAGYVTHNIYPFKITDNTLLAPSYVGWFYLVAGLPAVAFGGLFAAMSSFLGWRLLNRNYLECAPIAQVFFLWMLFIALTEGTLDGMGRIMLSGLASLIIVEFGLRLTRIFFARREPMKATT